MPALENVRNFIRDNRHWLGEKTSQMILERAQAAEEMGFNLQEWILELMASDSELADLFCSYLWDPIQIQAALDNFDQSAA